MESRTTEPCLMAKTIHVNPNFRATQKTHINPKFVHNHRAKIHMNPQFIKQAFFDQKEEYTHPIVPLSALNPINPIETVRSTPTKQQLSADSPSTVCESRKYIRSPEQKLENRYAKKSFGFSGKYKIDNRIDQSSYSSKEIYQSKSKENVKKYRFLNINGVLYKTTKNKLQRKGCLQKSHTSSRSSNNISLQQSNILVHKRLSEEHIKPPMNVLYKTQRPEFYFKRNFLYNSKHRSLQILRRRLIKSNIPCPIFQRLGRCIAFANNNCRKVHDRNHVAICQRFLHGECDRSCLFSHNISFSKMPVCLLYLQGICVNKVCPYLHKKLSEKTKLCEDFSNGFCIRAEQCDKRHESTYFMCRRYEGCKNSKCIHCKILAAYNHRKTNKVTGVISAKSRKDQNSNVQYSNRSGRYFDDTTVRHVESSGIKDNYTSESKNLQNTNILRPKLGILPSFISLT